MRSRRMQTEFRNFLLFAAVAHTPATSVVEPFHFGPAPALASQDGGSGSCSCSSFISSPVVHNLLLKKQVLKNFTSQFTGACFIHRKVRVLCFASPVLYLKGEINLVLHFVNIFVYFFSLNMGSELELVLQSWSRSRPFFHGSGSSQKGGYISGSTTLPATAINLKSKNCQKFVQ